MCTTGSSSGFSSSQWHHSVHMLHAAEQREGVPWQLFYLYVGNNCDAAVGIDDLVKQSSHGSSSGNCSSSGWFGRAATMLAAASIRMLRVAICDNTVSCITKFMLVAGGAKQQQQQ